MFTFILHHFCPQFYTRNLYNMRALFKSFIICKYGDKQKKMRLAQMHVRPKKKNLDTLVTSHTSQKRKHPPLMYYRKKKNISIKCCKQQQQPRPPTSVPRMPLMEKCN